MKKIVLLIYTVALILAGCSTVAGVGKDIESGGRAVENAANRQAS